MAQCHAQSITHQFSTAKFSTQKKPLNPKKDRMKMVIYQASQKATGGKGNVFCICFAICSNGRKNCVYLGEEVWNNRDGRAMNEE
jgi:hypothetical protein